MLAHMGSEEGLLRGNHCILEGKEPMITWKGCSGRSTEVFKISAGNFFSMFHKESVQRVLVSTSLKKNQGVHLVHHAEYSNFLGVCCVLDGRGCALSSFIKLGMYTQLRAMLDQLFFQPISFGI